MLDDMVITVKGSLTTKVFKPVPVNLAELCQLTINEVQTTNGSRHRLQFVNNTMLHLALLDETLISRILLNLLSNAVKFSPEGSEIRLELSQESEWLILSVSDQGMGISPDDQARVFEPFFRTSSAQSVPGTGLGLSIVKDCVIHHQGQIRLESTIGVGTTVFVEIPLVLPS
jgi:signal transduction histidine kinase